MTKLGGNQINAFKGLFPPPVLSTEDEKSFEQVLDKVTECVAPQNMIEWMCVRQYVCASWFIERYMRHATLAIERDFLEQREFATQQARLRLERKEKRATAAAERMSQTPADIAHLVSLENKMDELVDEVDDAMMRPAAERKHNRALQEGILFQEQLNALIVQQTKMRNDALQQLELYRVGLGQLTKEVTGKTIEAECKEISESRLTEAPSIAPTQESTEHDLPTPDRSKSAQ